MKIIWKFFLTPQGKKELEAGEDFGEMFIDDIGCNSELDFTTADQLGQLSEAPVIYEGYIEEGYPEVHGKAYAFMGYQVYSIEEVLLKNGEVEFECINDE